MWANYRIRSASVNAALEKGRGWGRKQEKRNVTEKSFKGEYMNMERKDLLIGNKRLRALSMHRYILNERW